MENCNYCRNEYEDSKYQHGTCIHCGAPKSTRRLIGYYYGEPIWSDNPSAEETIRSAAYYGYDCSSTT